MEISYQLLPSELVDLDINLFCLSNQFDLAAILISASGSPVTRWASVAFGAGVGIGSAYSDCSHKFGGTPAKFTKISDTSLSKVIYAYVHSPNHGLYCIHWEILPILRSYIVVVSEI